ncbi:30S ribosomal protein S8 [Candidatus Collierbacteria bacterium]|nr:30S ribosomal protein S8 [Candidatus Collierbacteria bacterium]
MDPIANLLTIIRNGYKAKKLKVSAPYSNQSLKLAQILVDEGYLKSVEKETDTNKPRLIMELSYLDNQPVLTSINRLSRGSVRLYAKVGRFPRTLSGAGITIISTSSGLMTDKKALKQHLGGEIICQVW